MTHLKLYSTTISTLPESLSALLDAAKLTSRIPTGQTILIKPNLVEALVPPITTPVFLMELLIDYLRKRIQNTDIIIGEGTGSLTYDTHYPFKMLGYTRLAEDKNIRLLDLNKE